MLYEDSSQLAHKGGTHHTGNAPSSSNRVESKFSNAALWGRGRHSKGCRGELTLCGLCRACKRTSQPPEPPQSWGLSVQLAICIWDKTGSWPVAKATYDSMLSVEAWALNTGRGVNAAGGWECVWLGLPAAATLSLVLHTSDDTLCLVVGK